MSSLENMRTRLEFNGGVVQENRMQQHKLKTLKKALLYSYQAATAVLQDGRRFRCLINPDKLKESADDKIISIPFKDICLGYKDKKYIPYKKTSQGEEEIGMKPGDVFQWEETDTYWLVYLRRYEEDAYFRAEVRKCEYEVSFDTQDGENKTYKVYLDGPTNEDIAWRTKSGESWNELNYNATMYITRDEYTEAYFHRFSLVDINGKKWEVQKFDEFSPEGILQIFLKEYYQNTIEDTQIQEEKEKKEEQKIEREYNIIKKKPYIEGPSEVYPYDKVEYTIKNAEEGTWQVSNSKKASIIESTTSTIKLGIITGKSGTFNLAYKVDGEEDVTLAITIKSL